MVTLSHKAQKSSYKVSEFTSLFLQGSYHCSYVFEICTIPINLIPFDFIISYSLTALAFFLGQTRYAPTHLWAFAQALASFQNALPADFPVVKSFFSFKSFLKPHGLKDAYPDYQFNAVTYPPPPMLNTIILL